MLKFNSLYCDMDSVLVDFPSGVSKVTGNPFREFWTHKPTIDKVNAEEKFWANLPWMHDGKQLWGSIKKLRPNILSAWPHWGKEQAIEGKHEWIQKHLTNVGSIHIVARDQKKDFARFNMVPNVLIDDWEDNIRDWRIHGGIGIHHISANSTIDKLREFGII